MITITQLIAVLFQVIILIGGNSSIPQDVKDQVIAEITQAVGKQTGIVSEPTPAQPVPPSTQTLAVPVEPITTPSMTQPTTTVGLKPIVNNIEYDIHYSEAAKSIKVYGQGFTGNMSVRIHNSNLPQDISATSSEVSSDGTNFAFDVPASLPIGRYDLYVYKDNVKVFQNVGDFSVIENN